MRRSELPIVVPKPRSNGSTMNRPNVSLLNLGSVPTRLGRTFRVQRKNPVGIANRENVNRPTPESRQPEPLNHFGCSAVRGRGNRNHHGDTEMRREAGEGRG